MDNNDWHNFAQGRQVSTAKSAKNDAVSWGICDTRWSICDSGMTFRCVHFEVLDGGDHFSKAVILFGSKVPHIFSMGAVCDDEKERHQKVVLFLGKLPAGEWHLLRRAPEVGEWQLQESEPEVEDRPEVSSEQCQHRKKHSGVPCLQYQKKVTLSVVWRWENVQILFFFSEIHVTPCMTSGHVASGGRALSKTRAEQE